MWKFVAGGWVGVVLLGVSVSGVDSKRLKFKNWKLPVQGCA